MTRRRIKRVIFRFTAISTTKRWRDIIFKEFGLTEKGHIYLRACPRESHQREDPIKAGGKILCIDAGFAKAYQKETGMAGCTLTYNSYGMNLIIHEPFGSLEKAIAEGMTSKAKRGW
jgi:fructose-1,6-bisphosphatase-3